MNKSVMKCCICNNENIGEFVTINDKKYHLCCIEQLQQENQELKRQLEEYKEQVSKGLYNICLPYKNGYDKAIKYKENQQKEFIEYMNEKIDICDGFIDTVRSDLEEISYGGRIAGKTYIANEIMKNEAAKKILEEILSKYQEIVGVSHE